ncbi:hypothetical protein AJ79_00628 [Helicocarpus griseus UAMH5409]|uniref:Decapping enzyme Dcp1 n=1 Tax=Helicocarpus griseus UAMH5409 TaxID=1447875 RepID=A0A2B7YB17_9EURO|nr:hypothetical protein AJ79_00628 [Helicocarpus griseus UAMH5409]
MALRRGQDRRSNNMHHNNNNHHQQTPSRSLHNRNPSNLAQPSDYESDIQTYYVSENPPTNGSPSSSAMATQQSQINPPSRTNEELNLAVLQRHNPSIVSILSLAPYAVVYIFSATTQLWEKSGIEGTMFVCQLTQGELGEERYSVLVLNRRGMQNFEAKLADGDDVEITEEYVILKVVAEGGAGASSTVKSADGSESIIYGLWIFSEPPPSSTAETRALNAQVIKECAVHGGQSRKIALERAAAAQAEGEGAYQGVVPMGRQISLKELFGQQRQQDDEWSVKIHSPASREVDAGMQPATQNPQAGYFQQQAPPPPQEKPTDEVLARLFMKVAQRPPDGLPGRF